MSFYEPGRNLGDHVSIIINDWEDGYDNYWGLGGADPTVELTDEDREFIKVEDAVGKLL